MMEQEIIVGQPTLPQILALNKGGEPLHWINFKECLFYEAKGKIAWTDGRIKIALRGGTNAKTGERTIVEIDTIVAVDSNISPTKYRQDTPSLTNAALFSRDMNICAYCGERFSDKHLTRDHVVPTSKGGPNNWMNVVASCRQCNQKKDDRTPEQAHMPLRYVPYIPSFNEALILKNHRILGCQMEWLLGGVSKDSRIRQAYENGTYPVQ
jgi:5-methylcytosine-specific restriction endonuclease McrA